MQVHKQLTDLLEEVRRDPVMGVVMVRAEVAREAWLLEAIIVAMELFLAEAETRVVTVMASGLRVAAGASQVLCAAAPDKPEVTRKVESRRLRRG